MAAGARIEGEPGYVLHTRAFGETSLIVEAFTPAHGRVGLMAKGARAGKSRLRGLLQVGQPLLLAWREAGELGALNSAEPGAEPVALQGEPLFCTWYLNELLMKLLPRGQPQPALFLAYTAALPQLAASARATLRLFELGLLEALGEALVLPGELQADALYAYDWETGPVPALPSATPTLRVSGASLIALRDHQADAPALHASRALLQAALQRQLGRQKLETPALLRQLLAAE